MKSTVSPDYLNYLISNLVLLNDWLDKFGVGNDSIVIDEVNQIANTINKIMNRMQELGIDVSQIANESFNINEHIRDFKIKRLLENERS